MRSHLHLCLVVALAALAGCCEDWVVVDGQTSVGGGLGFDSRPIAAPLPETQPYITPYAASGPPMEEETGYVTPYAGGMAGGGGGGQGEWVPDNYAGAGATVGGGGGSSMSLYPLSVNGPGAPPPMYDDQQMAVIANESYQDMQALPPEPVEPTIQPPAVRQPSPYDRVFAMANAPVVANVQTVVVPVPGYDPINKVFDAKAYAEGRYLPGYPPIPPALEASVAKAQAEFAHQRGGMVGGAMGYDGGYAATSTTTTYGAGGYDVASGSYAPTTTYSTTTTYGDASMPALGASTGYGGTSYGTTTYSSGSSSYGGGSVSFGPTVYGGTYGGSSTVPGGIINLPDPPVIELPAHDINAPSAPMPMGAPSRLAPVRVPGPPPSAGTYGGSSYSESFYIGKAPTHIRPHLTADIMAMAPGQTPTPMPRTQAPAGPAMAANPALRQSGVATAETASITVAAMPKPQGQAPGTPTVPAVTPKVGAEVKSTGEAVPAMAAVPAAPRPTIKTAGSEKEADVAGEKAVNTSGFRLVPAPDVPPGNHPTDAAPSQWFEIIRPGNVAMRIGRLSTTCVCVAARAPERFVKEGERALIEARVLTRPKVNPITYGLYVSVLEPVNVNLDVDVNIFIKK